MSFSIKFRAGGSSSSSPVGSFGTQCFSNGIDAFLKSLGGRGSGAQPVLFPGISVSGGVDALIRGVIHIPGLRGNPERLYPVTAVGNVFPGQFQTYVASVISQASSELVHGLGDDLRTLGLTWKVRAAPVSDTQVEIQVGRLIQAQQGGAQDLVSIADVGLGVSQVLPILVALRVARPGQLVIVEQPEIHLHPHAQVELARLVGASVSRGVRVVVETHSDLMVLAYQTLVAEETIQSRQVILHWFTRELGGRTVVKSNAVDDAGSFGDWPEDFADVQLSAKDEYLTAAEPKMQLFEEWACRHARPTSQRFRIDTSSTRPLAERPIAGGVARQK